MKNKNITRIFTLLLALCMCFSMMSTTTFAAEIHTNAEVSTAFNNGEMSTRAVEYNQVWIDANRMDAGSFRVTNPHPFGGDGECRLRLESNATNVRMNVTVSAGTTTYFSRIITVGEGDITFPYDGCWQSEFIVHYSVVTKSSSHGMRLNCWLS